MPYRHVEFRHRDWTKAANGIIQKLKAADVKMGQVVGINAHSEGNIVIFVAHYDTDLPPYGNLELYYNDQEVNDNWPTVYDAAANAASMCELDDIVSITGSCDEKNCGAMYVFYYKWSNQRHANVNHCEVRSNSWMTVLEEMREELTNQGVQAGQLISVDAHKGGPNEAAVLIAYWNSSAPGRGPLNLQWKHVNQKGDWETQYKFVDDNLNGYNLLPISITYAVDEHGRAATYLFYEDDEITVDFDIHNGKVVATDRKVMAQEIGINLESECQTIEISYNKQHDESSTFIPQYGTRISPGTAFEATVPFVASGVIKSSLIATPNFSWGATTSKSKLFKESFPMEIGLNTKVTCEVLLNESKIQVPFTIVRLSGKVTRGVFEGVSYWGIDSAISEDVDIPLEELKREFQEGNEDIVL